MRYLKTILAVVLVMLMVSCSSIPSSQVPLDELVLNLEVDPGFTQGANIYVSAIQEIDGEFWEWVDIEEDQLFLEAAERKPFVIGKLINSPSADIDSGVNQVDVIFVRSGQEYRQTVDIPVPVRLEGIAGSRFDGYYYLFQRDYESFAYRAEVTIACDDEILIGQVSITGDRILEEDIRVTVRRLLRQDLIEQDVPYRLTVGLVDKPTANPLFGRITYRFNEDQESYLTPDKKSLGELATDVVVDSVVSAVFKRSLHKVNCQYNFN